MQSEIDRDSCSPAAMAGAGIHGESVIRLACTRFVLLAILVSAVLPQGLPHAYAGGLPVRTATGVLINQVGYLPEAAKYVFVAQPVDSFFVVATGSGTRVHAGRFQLWKSNDPATGLTLYRGDFTAVTREGTYQIQTSAAGSSPAFVISETVYGRLYGAALKAFYHQRCGLQLVPAHAGVYARSRCHGTDGFYHASAETSGFVSSTGGWHDAGDYGKYVVNTGVTVGTLLLAYELFPFQLQQDALGIPESGNGVPDLLDEVRYELEWLLRMQFPNGGVSHKLTAPRFEGFIMPHQDSSQRYLYRISSTATGDFAAMMAKAARVFSVYDTSFSRNCLTAAQKAWSYLAAHPGIVPAGGFRNPTGTNTGEYGDGDDRDERLWAAAELFITTGEAGYHQYYQSHYRDTGLLNQPFGWPQVRALAHVTYLLGARPGKSATIMAQLEQSLLSYCQTQVTRRDQSGLHLLLQPGEFWWGSNGEVLNRAAMLIVGASLTGDQRYTAVALDQLHYILGVNPHGMSFVTGAGTYAPMHPHHRPSEADGITAPVPGLLVGGPNQNLDDDALRARFNASTPPALCYLDELASYGSNEIAINWNAPLVFVAGFFGASPFLDVEGRPQFVPHRFNLGPNYPNPFRTATTFTLELSQPEALQLRICDLLGRAVLERKLGVLPAGRSRWSWQAMDANGRTLPAGTYFLTLAGTQYAVTRKILLLP